MINNEWQNRNEPFRTPILYSMLKLIIYTRTVLISYKPQRNMVRYYHYLNKEGFVRYLFETTITSELILLLYLKCIQINFICLYVFIVMLTWYTHILKIIALIKQVEQKTVNNIYIFLFT